VPFSFYYKPYLGLVVKKNLPICASKNDLPRENPVKKEGNRPTKPLRHWWPHPADRCQSCRPSSPRSRTSWRRPWT